MDSAETILSGKNLNTEGLGGQQKKSCFCFYPSHSRWAVLKPCEGFDGPQSCPWLRPRARCLTFSRGTALVC